MQVQKKEQLDACFKATQALQEKNQSLLEAVDKLQSNQKVNDFFEDNLFYLEIPVVVLQHH